ncbi:MAG: hypothetical protein HQL23_00940 [Candidatus Omnitrophica bacterium]|nr:hypothetical protein [Candidatus Omnitrophota bacterium]
MAVETKTGDAESGGESIVWIFAAAAPALTLLWAFILQKWSWGLMDDISLLNLPGNIFQRAWTIYRGFLAFGELKPIFALHAAVFYQIFAGFPTGFYVFKLLETVLTLAVWGLAARRLTGQKISFYLVPAIALSFHYVYDIVFYLSSHEIYGLFFLGLAVLSFLKSIGPAAAPTEGGAAVVVWSWPAWCAGLVYLFLSFSAKETFAPLGAAVGVYYLFWAGMSRREKGVWRMAAAGVLVLAATALYIWILLHIVRTGYTTSYHIFDFAKISANAWVWMKKDLLNHAPWLAGAWIVWRTFNRKNPTNRVLANLPPGVRAGMVLGICFYLFFLGGLLPWNTAGYYAAPLGFFFAFILALAGARPLAALPLRQQCWVIFAALCLNQLVCFYALDREMTYHADSDQLMAWISNNPSFAGKNNLGVYCNGMEAAGAIPMLINRFAGREFLPFHYAAPAALAQAGKNCAYYLYSPRFGNLNPGFVQGWEAAFASRHWTMYQRPVDKKEAR